MSLFKQTTSLDAKRYQKVRFVGAGFVTIALASSAALAQPVRIISKDASVAHHPSQTREAAASKLAQPGNIIYQNENAWLVRDEDAAADDFQDLYVVNAHGWTSLPTAISRYGETIAFEPGEFAVMRLAKHQLEDLSGLLHGSGKTCGSLVKLDGELIEIAPLATPVPIIPVTIREDRVERAVGSITAGHIHETVDELAAIHTRFHSSLPGGEIAELLKAKYDALAVGRSDVTTTVYDHGLDTDQPSLVVRIQGATKPEEIIVLGSHLDSVNWSNPTRRAPGADDNASGTATNLEIFRVLMEEGIRPERTIEIHAYAAEEIGLIGSADIAADYKSQGLNVIAMVQHDMTLWKAEGAPDKIWFVTSNTNGGLNDMLGLLVDNYVGLPWDKGVLRGGSSDHASWHRRGFAAAFPFENPSRSNPHIHTANDTVENADAFAQAAGFAKLGLAFAMHFGGLQ